MNFCGFRLKHVMLDWRDVVAPCELEGEPDLRKFVSSKRNGISLWMSFTNIIMSYRLTVSILGPVMLTPDVMPLLDTNLRRAFQLQHPDDGVCLAM